MNCGECLMRDVKIVALVNGVCPVCAADYRLVSKPDGVEALRRVVYHKLKMWDESDKAEESLGLEIDTGAESFDAFCAGLGSPEDALTLSIADLVEAFSLDGKGVTDETNHASKIVQDVYAALDERRARGGETSGIPSGFASLDRITAGFQPGRLIVIAARPGVGKTAILVNTARHIAARTPMLFVSLEQSRLELTERLIACVGEIDSHRLTTGRLRSDETERTFAAGEAISRSALFIDDASNQTLLQLAANIRRMKRLHGIRLAMIDYLQLIVPDAKKETRQEQVASISRRLKLLARELKIPIIVAAQLNRETEKRTDSRPKLSDLRESGAIEQDADVVILLHRPTDERGHSEGIVEAIVAKHRNGPTGIAPLLYVKHHMRFEDYRQ